MYTYIYIYISLCILHVDSGAYVIQVIQIWLVGSKYGWRKRSKSLSTIWIQRKTSLFWTISRFFMISGGDSKFLAWIPMSMDFTSMFLGEIGKINAHGDGSTLDGCASPNS